MSFVPNCQHDVFVSYAHVDDLPFPGTEKGWVTTFVETLEVLLAQKLGRRDAYSLWMDPQLSRHEKLTPEILRNLEGSATLLVFLSPGYLASEWCLREKDSFVAALEGSPLEGSRIFIVERDKVDFAERPAQFEDLLGYRFWVQEGEGQPTRILGVPQPNPANPRDLPYFDELTRCASNLADHLRRLREATESRSEGNGSTGKETAAAAAGADERRTVLLAEATDDLETESATLRRNLEQAGLRVLPETWYPRDPEAFAAAVDADLAASDLFVQLLSGLPGRRPPGLSQGYVRAQHERALAAGKPILQRRSRRLEPESVEDDQYRAFLDSETVMAVGLEEFRRTVVERAARLDEEEADHGAPGGAGAAEPGETLVFIDADGADIGLAEAVGEAMERHGLAYTLPLPGASPAETREDLEANLLVADALVVVWGEAPARWVRNQLLLLRKVAWKRDRPLAAVALVEDPPGGGAEREPLRLALPNLIRLEWSEEDGEAALAPLLEALGKPP